MKKKLYSIVLTLIVIGSTFMLIRNKILKKESELVTVKIDYLRCKKDKSGSIPSKYERKRSGIIKVLYNGKQYPIKINESLCSELNVNDTLEVLYSSTDNKMFLKTD